MSLQSGPRGIFPAGRFGFIRRPDGHTIPEGKVTEMENTGVTCDVCACTHNLEGCKCELPEIHVTEKCGCHKSVDNPHFCRSFEQK